jgi:hypothetical protein
MPPSTACDTANRNCSRSRYHHAHLGEELTFGGGAHVLDVGEAAIRHRQHRVGGPIDAAASPDRHPA